LRESLGKAVEVPRSVGVLAVVVDAMDETAKGFYLKYGFVAFRDHPLTLFLPLATIKGAMA
jgi:hypothetical protein